MEISNAIARWCWTLRWWMLALITAVTVLAIWQSSFVSIDNSPSSWFVEDDPQVETYRNFIEWFGSDDVIIITFTDRRGLITSDGYRLLERATRSLEELDDVERVVSILDFDRRGLIKIVFSNIGVDGLISATRDFPLARRLFSDDGETIAIIVQFKIPTDLTAKRGVQITQLEETLANLDTSHRKAGFRIIYATLNKLTELDIRKFYLINFLLIFLVIYFFFRAYRPVFLSLVAALVGIAWFLGLYTSMGRSLNVVTMVIPTVIMTIGVANCVHLFAYIRQLPQSLSSRDRIILGITRMFWPCLLASLTTAVGFLSLMTSDLPMLRDLGLFSAVGIFGVFVVSVIACTFVGNIQTDPSKKLTFNLQAAVLSFVNFGARKPILVITIFALLVAGGGYMSSKVEVDAYPIDLLFPNHAVRKDSKFIEETLGPYMPLEFIVSSDEGVLRPETIIAVSQWQEAAQELENIAWSRSIVDGINYYIKRSRKSEIGELSLPPGDEEIIRAIDWYKGLPGSDYRQLVNSPTALRVTFGTYNQSAKRLDDTIKQIMSLSSFSQDVKLEASGLMPIWLTQVNSILSSQISSFSLAFVLIFSLIALGLRSWKLSLAALPVNLLPVVAALAIMGLFEIRLDLGTVAVASVILGLVVDDTIHFFFRLREELKHSESIDAALEKTATSIGKSIVVTSCALLSGFAILALGSVKSVIWFGVLISTAIVTALIADLVLSSSLIMLLKPKTNTQND